jgi:pilus assembly protein CpaB
MNKRLIAVFLFAVFVAGLASLVVIKVVGGGGPREAKQVTTLQVWAASRDLPVGSMVQPADVTAAQWAGTVPQGAAQKTGDLCPWVGRGVTTRIFQNEPIVEGRLAPKGAGAGLASTIPPGSRAVAVRVDEIVGEAGFVVPGQRVDVLISGTPPGGGAASGTLEKTLLQNVTVLSAGQNLEKDPEGKPISVTVVNLLVNPEDAELLTLATKETRVQLVLRNPTDDVQVKTTGTSVARLFLGVKAPGGADVGERRAPRVVVKPVVVAPVVKEAPPVLVEVIQGNSRSTVKFAEEGR